jgi:hypothetical protein
MFPRNIGRRLLSYTMFQFGFHSHRFEYLKSNIPCIVLYFQITSLAFNIPEIPRQNFVTRRLVARILYLTADCNLNRYLVKSLSVPPLKCCNKNSATKYITTSSLHVIPKRELIIMTQFDAIKSVRYLKCC